MILVELFVGEDCSLCEKARTVIQGLRQEFSFVLHEERLTPGNPRYGEYRDNIPVVHINGAFFCHHTVNEPELRTTLQRLSPSIVNKT
jgi:hypothetical protein